MAESSDDGRKRSFQEFRETESLSEALAVWETLRDRDGRGLRDLGEVWQAGATVSGFLAGLAGVQEDLRGGCAGLAGRRAVVVGAGPVGLVQATMLALMGAKVQLVEARKEFSRFVSLNFPFFLLEEMGPSWFWIFRFFLLKEQCGAFVAIDFGRVEGLGDQAVSSEAGSRWVASCGHQGAAAGSPQAGVGVWMSGVLWLVSD